ncbi:MAG: ZIP family metal transporter [Ignavibacteriales bacterium]|nr:ZIP family metal transporter [Ignavibacteriales bacterium]
MQSILFQSTLAFISALAGAFLIFKITLNHNKLCVLISLSGGALAGAAFVNLLPSASEYLSITELILSAVSGYGLFWLINKYYFHVCPACSASHFDEQTTKKFSEIVMLLFTALAFHSFLDGVAIASGISDSDHGVFSAVLAHKFPEGIALASLMIGANYPKKRIFEFVFLVEITTIIGALVGHFALPVKSGFVMGLIQGHISGSFLYLAFHALAGEIFRNHKMLVISSFVAGLLSIWLITLFIH